MRTAAVATIRRHEIQDAVLQMHSEIRRLLCHVTGGHWITAVWPCFIQMAFQKVPWVCSHLDSLLSLLALNFSKSHLLHIRNSKFVEFVDFQWWKCVNFQSVASHLPPTSYDFVTYLLRQRHKFIMSSQVHTRGSTNSYWTPFENERHWDVQRKVSRGPKPRITIKSNQVTLRQSKKSECRKTKNSQNQKTWRLFQDLKSISVPFSFSFWTNKANL